MTNWHILNDLKCSELFLSQHTCKDAPNNICCSDSRNCKVFILFHLFTQELALVSIRYRFLPGSHSLFHILLKNSIYCSKCSLSVIDQHSLNLGLIHCGHGNLVMLLINVNRLLLILLMVGLEPLGRSGSCNYSSLRYSRLPLSTNHFGLL
jgi:hypothetical protein